MKTSAALFLTDILPHKRRWYNRVVKNRVFGNSTPEYVFSTLKKSGVKGIELFLPLYAKAAYDDIYEVKKLLDLYDMPVLSVHQTLRLIRKTKFAEITQFFHIADILSAKVIVLHINSLGKQIFDKEFIAMLHSLQKKYGIKIGFENREKFIGSYLKGYSWHEDKFSSLIKQSDLHITLDTTHLAQAGGNIVDFFKKNKDRIVNIHISDYKPHMFNSSLRPLRFKHMPLGKGVLPIKEFIRTLRKEQYKGLVTLEIHTDLEGMCESAEVISKSSKESN